MHEKIKQVKKEKGITMYGERLLKPIPIPTPKLSIERIIPMIIASFIDKILSLFKSAFVASKAIFKNNLKLKIFIVTTSLHIAFLLSQIFMISLKNFTKPTIINNEKEKYLEKSSLSIFEKRKPIRIPHAKINVFMTIISNIVLKWTFILEVP